MADRCTDMLVSQYVLSSKFGAKAKSRRTFLGSQAIKGFLKPWVEGG